MFKIINCFLILFLIGLCESTDPCIITYNNVTYDFRSLSIRSHNFKIKNDKNQTFSINICSKSNFGQYEKNCKMSTSICLIEKDVAYDIANSKKGNLIENNGSFSINYGLTTHYKNCEKVNSQVNFLCDQSRPHEFEPEFVSYDNCTFTFQWRTMFACHQKHSMNLNKHEIEPLKYKINDETIMDFKQILKPGILNVTYGTKDEKYNFFIQNKESENTYTNCKGSFICQVNPKTNFSRSLGIAKQNVLEYGNRGFHLIMTANNPCGRNPGKNASTILNFFCKNETLNTFEYETNLCEYLISIHDPIICDYQNKLDVLLKNDKFEAKQETNLTAFNQQFLGTYSNVYPDNLKENSSNTTMLGFAILTVVSVIGIVLAAFSLINDDRRTWLQNRLRRIIGPQTATSFHYSQLSTNFLLNNDRNDNFNSPYLPTTLPKNNEQKIFKNYNEIEDSNLKEKSSIREQLDKLRIINDNDLGVSQNNFPSFKLPKSRLIEDLNDKDVEINLLN